MNHPTSDDDCRDYWEFFLTVMAEQQQAEEREKNQDSPSRDDHGDKEEETK